MCFRNRIVFERLFIIVCFVLVTKAGVATCYTMQKTKQNGIISFNNVILSSAPVCKKSASFAGYIRDGWLVLCDSSL